MGGGGKPVIQWPAVSTRLLATVPVLQPMMPVQSLIVTQPVSIARTFKRRHIYFVVYAGAGVNWDADHANTLVLMT